MKHTSGSVGNLRQKTLFICRAAMIAALYVALTLLANALGLANYAIQLRFSEAMCILPFFTPAAIPGLYVGCLLANLLTGAHWLDVLVGPVATLLGALGAYALRNLVTRFSGAKWLISVPNIIANSLIVPVLVFVCYTDVSERSLPVLFYTYFTVFVGEVLSCLVLGMILFFALRPVARRLFGEECPGFVRVNSSARE